MTVVSSSVKSAVDPLHQQGSANTAWTIANTSEVVPTVLTPLGASAFWGDPCELELLRGYARMGLIAGSQVRLKPADDRMVAVVYGRMTANVDSFRRLADSMPGTSGDAMEQQYFGSVRPGVHNHPTRKRYPVMAMKLPVAAALLKRRLDAVRASTEQWWIRSTIDAPPTTEAAACSLLVEASQRFRDAMWLHMQATVLCQGGYEQIVALAAAAGKPGLEMRLSTGFGGIEETEVLKDLWELSRDRLTLEGFLRRHGYHGAGEGEPLNPSWRHQPSLLTQRVASYRGLSEDRSPAVVERTRIAERRRAEAEVIAALGKSGRARAIPTLRMGARFIRAKETGKVAYTQAIDAGRCAAHVLGDHLAKRGALDESGDVFYLTLDELSVGCPADARDLVATRRARHAEYSAMRLPLQWIGSPEPRTVTPMGEGADRVRELRGVPVCAGVVTGRVHVITDPDDTDDFEPGDVLACHVTDPAWMPLLNIAGALVIDVGGPMSHCAIASRELGIPAVISTGNGTDLLRTGDTVRVDAGAGLVTIVKDA